MVDHTICHTENVQRWFFIDSIANSFDWEPKNKSKCFFLFFSGHFIPLILLNLHLESSLFTYNGIGSTQAFMNGL